MNKTPAREPLGLVGAINRAEARDENPYRSPLSHGEPLEIGFGWLPKFVGVLIALVWSSGIGSIAAKAFGLAWPAEFFSGMAAGFSAVYLTTLFAAFLLDCFWGRVRIR